MKNPYVVHFDFDCHSFAFAWPRIRRMPVVNSWVHMWLNSPVSNLWTKKPQLRQKIGRMTIYWENNFWFRPTIHTGKQAWDTRKKLAICTSSICSRNLWFARCDILFTGLSTLHSCPWSWGNCRHRPRHTKPPPTHWLECPKRQAFASQVPKVPKGHGWTLKSVGESWKRDKK